MLAGVGHRNMDGSNFLVVKPGTILIQLLCTTKCISIFEVCDVSKFRYGSGSY